eukprot:CCRYP_000532-RA/>CCRYP_000532-RA protein AED:0.40 eAED:0.40 QI:148/0.66/0.5/1/0.33/0.25/4/316/519
MMEGTKTPGGIDRDEATNVITKEVRVDSMPASIENATKPSPDNAPKARTVPTSSTAPPRNTSSDPIPTDEYAFLTPPHFSASNLLHKSLFSLDASFRCSICGELYVAPVAVLPCLHTFCSECVRRHCKWGMGGMKRECRCPECNQLIGTKKGQNDYENAILPNHHFENQLDIYKQMRDGLLSSFVRLDVLEKERTTRQKSEPINGKMHEHGGEGNIENKRHHDGEEKKERAPKRSCRKIAKTTTYDYSSDSDNDNDPDYESSQTHSQPSNKSKPKITLQRKTVVSYHGLKRKRLESAELLKEINKRETERKREATRAIQNGSQRHESYMNKLKKAVELRGKGSNTTLTSGDAAFDATMRNGFRELIQKGRARMGDGKENNALDCGINATDSVDPKAVDKCSLDMVKESPVTGDDSSATEPISESSSPAAFASEKYELSQLTAANKQTPSTPRPPRQKKKKSPSQTCTIKIIDAGPWTCARCTLRNERNTTAKARCELCDAPRTERGSEPKGVEVVNIDC